MQNPAIPTQSIEQPEFDKKESSKSVITGSVAGSVVGFLPGLSAGIATILAMGARKSNDNEQVITTLSSVNTANAFFVTIALFLILRPRSGAAIVVNELISVQRWDAVSPPLVLIYILIIYFNNFNLNIYLRNNFIQINYCSFH